MRDHDLPQPEASLIGAPDGIHTSALTAHLLALADCVFGLNLLLGAHWQLAFHAMLYGARARAGTLHAALAANWLGSVRQVDAILRILPILPILRALHAQGLRGLRFVLLPFAKTTCPVAAAQPDAAAMPGQGAVAPA